MTSASDCRRSSGGRGSKQILDFPLDEAEHRALEASAAALSDVLAEIEPNLALLYCEC